MNTSFSPCAVTIPQQVALPCLKRHADPEFVRAPRHRVRHHAVHPDGGEAQRNHREKSHEKQDESV
jgi:hypothetical protein